MKSILIPTDFSATSRNASLYAVNMATTIGIPKLIFYHFYETKLVFTPAGKLDEAATIEPSRAKSEEDLQNFVDSLGTISEKIEVELYQGASSVNEGILEVSKITNPDLIIMGITGGGILKETFLGTHTLSVAKQGNIPVLIIPNKATFNHYGNVTILSDFKDVEKYTPVEKLKTILDHGKTDLSILHLLKSGEQVDDTHPEKLKLEQLFKSYSPKFQYKKSEHFTDDIIDFVSENSVDIITIFPKHHGLIETLFNSHTKKLAFHSQVPLLVLHN
jgi:nucleotide-binding universal stress UspA family protein